MGRTVLAASQRIADHKQELSAFKKALATDERAAFDAIYESAIVHNPSIVYMSPVDIFEGIFLANVVEMRRKINDLYRRLDEVERRVRELKEPTERATL